MDQRQLIDRLEERVADVSVGVPPVAEMRAAARRRHRARTALLASVVVVVALVTGISAWQVTGSGRQATPADRDAPPIGYRYVGLGNAVIAVPDDWTPRAHKCARVDGDEVFMEGGTTCLAAASTSSEVESIQIRQFRPERDDAGDWTAREIDGEETRWSPVDSHTGVITGSVYVPAYDVVFVARSTSENATAVVEDRLDGIAMLQAHTVLPGFDGLTSDVYADELRALGLAVHVTHESAWGELGTVLAVNPPVGTIVAPGDTIIVTASR